MITLIIAIIASIVIITFLIILFVLKKKPNKKIEKKTTSPQPETILTKQVPQEKEILEKIEIIKVVDQNRPSPQRPITKEDAIIIDLLRQHSELPGGVVELSQILKDPDVKIKKVVQIISTYPVLSAKILRVVNSAAFTSSKITSIQHAVVILGFNNLWLLMNQLLTNSTLASFSKLPQEKIKALWRHGAAVATCAKHVLLHTNLSANDLGPVVYTCALLHDVGKFLLKGLSPSISIRDDKNDINKNFSVLGEDSAYGLDHCRAGYLITTHWKLPEILCTTISYHHHPSFSNWKDIPKHAQIPTILVAISDAVANFAGYYEEQPGTFEINQECLRHIGLDKNWNPNMLISQELIKELKDTEQLIEAATSL